MKRLSFLLILLAVTFTLSAQSGIQFANLSWSETLAKAKTENKLIFVDAYTTWCGPCKAMDKNIFPLESVGAYFNENFVNVKFDMEKGEGLNMAQNYKVAAYPSFLFINGDGDLVHKGLGYHQEDQFVALGQAANDPTRQLIVLRKAYLGGDQSAKLLRNYTKALYDIGDRNYSKVADEYLQTQDDWATEENMDFILGYANNLNGKGYEYLINNRPAFNDLFGEDQVTGRIVYKIQSEIYNGEEAISLDQISSYYQEAVPEKAEQLTLEFKLDYYLRAGDVDKFALTAVTLLDKYPTDNPNLLNELAWNFYLAVEDENLLKRAVSWAEQSVELDNQFFNNDTLGALYYKTGKNKKAKKHLQIAIDLAKAEGYDPSESQALLDEVNGK
ncbi:MAG: thioredoxin family protein [Bacteroidota bacterium]